MPAITEPPEAAIDLVARQSEIKPARRFFGQRTVEETQPWS